MPGTRSGAGLFFCSPADGVVSTTATAGSRGRVRVAVTRPAGSADTLNRSLEAWGAVPLSFPLTVVAAPADDAALRAAARQVAAYDWVVFTSANGVAALLAAGDRSSVVAALHRVRVGVVGSATEAALAELGVAVAAIPPRFTGEALAERMASLEDLRGARVLWPRAAGARPGLGRSLRGHGAVVDEVEAYRTNGDPDAGGALAAAVGAGEVDVLAFTAPSAVRAYREAGGNQPAGVRLVVIGPVTAAEALRAGYRVDGTAPESTMEALSEEIRRICTPTERR